VCLDGGGEDAGSSLSNHPGSIGDPGVEGVEGIEGSRNSRRDSSAFRSTLARSWDAGGTRVAGLDPGCALFTGRKATPPRMAASRSARGSPGPGTTAHASAAKPSASGAMDEQTRRASRRDRGGETARLVPAS
jgi:hypothetical protein